VCATTVSVLLYSDTGLVFFKFSLLWWIGIGKRIHVELADVLCMILRFMPLSHCICVICAFVSFLCNFCLSSACRRY
jgi:hypothetical protein